MSPPHNDRKYPPGIYRRGNIFWIRYSRAGRKYWESTGSTKVTDAKRLLELRKGQIHLPLIKRRNE